MHQRSRSVLLLVAGTCAAALVAVGGGPAEVLASLGRPADGDPFAPLVAAATLLAQVLAGYLVVVSALALAADLPGLLGTGARTCVARLSPPLLRRVLGIALGVTTAVATAGVGPAVAAGPSSPRSGATVPALDWPAPVPAPAVTSASLDWPGAQPPSAHPTAPAPATPAPATPALATHAAATPAAAVTVARGDTLWGIAARHLPAAAGDAAIARAWPAWWSANRDAIGADPDLITPGTHLAPPAPPAR